MAVLFKIYPKEGALEKVLEEVKNLGAVGAQAEDVAFGIKIVRALFKFDDSNASSSQIEEKIKALDGVSEVEIDEESLI
ncbi:MAG: hypothetical protein ACP5SA_02465 [Candidatus Micrarchaeia archaeon]